MLVVTVRPPLGDVDLAKLDIYDWLAIVNGLLRTSRFLIPDFSDDTIGQACIRIGIVTNMFTFFVGDSLRLITGTIISDIRYVCLFA